MYEEREEQEFIDLEQEERELTDEAILAMMFVIATTKENVEKELRNFYQKYGKDGVVTYAEARKWVSEQNHQRRLTALLLFLGGEFAIAQDKLETHFRTFLTSIVDKESTFFGVKVDVTDVLNKPWGIDELRWLDRLEADVNLWKATIAKDIKQAMHRGASLDDVLTQLEKRFGSIDKVLEKLGLTESTAVGSLSRYEIFKEMGITKYQFFTKPDERRCEECGALHGKIFPISAFEVGVTASPIHPHCRCWEVPIDD